MRIVSAVPTENGFEVPGTIQHTPVTVKHTRHRKPVSPVKLFFAAIIGTLLIVVGILWATGNVNTYGGMGVHGIVFGNSDACHDLGFEWGHGTLGAYLNQCD